MGVTPTYGYGRHWAVVLEMPDQADLRLSTAEAQYRTLQAQLDPTDYPSDHEYLIAKQDLANAYDQACRELGNPG